MPAPLTPLDDESPLDGDTVQVAPRVAWVLRMARLSADGGRSQAAVGATLREAGIRTHARLMSEIENGKVRSGRIVGGYEQALGLAEGRLRAPIDVMCRALPGEAPPDRDDAVRALGGEMLSVARLSELSARVARPGCSGGDWLAWARALSVPDARGFPDWLAAQWLDRLIDELGRSVGTAYVTRYEALAKLRTGPYGSLTLEAARRSVAHPHAQVVLDTVSALSDTPDADLVDWLCGLVGSPRPLDVRAGCNGLSNAALVGGLDSRVWDRVVEPVAAAYNAAVAADDAGRRALFSRLVVSLPRPQWQALKPLLAAKPLRPPRYGPLGAKTQTNRRWRIATELAERIAEPDALPDRPLLTRLLLEAVYDHRETRAFPAVLLLVSVPFADRVFDVLHDYAVHEAAPHERSAIVWRLTQMRPSATMGDLERLNGFDTDLRACRAVLLAHAGRRVEPEILDDLLASPDQRRRAIYAAGMVEDPWLEKISQDQSYPEPMRGAAAWWQGRGGLIDDGPSGG